MWMWISIFGVVVGVLIVWALFASVATEGSPDPRCAEVKSRESFKKDCDYLVSVGLLRGSDCRNFLCFSDMLAQLYRRYSRGFHTGHRPRPRVEDSLMSLNMKILTTQFDNDPSEQTLFEVYGKVSRLCVEAQKVEKDLKLAKKYKAPYSLNFEGEVYWVLPN